MSNPEQAPELSTNPSVAEVVPGVSPSTAQNMGELAVPVLIDTVPGMTTDSNSTIPSREVVTVSRPGDPGHEEKVAAYLAEQSQNLTMQQAAIDANNPHNDQ